MNTRGPQVGKKFPESDSAEGGEPTPPKKTEGRKASRAKLPRENFCRRDHGRRGRMQNPQQNQGENMTARELIKEWIDTIARYRADTDAANRFGLSPECTLVEGCDKLAERYTERVEAAIGDANETLQWYWLENDLGKRAMKASGGRIKRAKAIRTIDDLCELLGVE